MSLPENTVEKYELLRQQVINSLSNPSEDYLIMINQGMLALAQHYLKEHENKIKIDFIPKPVSLEMKEPFIHVLVEMIMNLQQQELHYGI